MSDYGDCTCCAHWGIASDAVSNLGLCRECGSRAVSECERKHARSVWTGRRGKK